MLKPELIIYMLLFPPFLLFVVPVLLLPLILLGERLAAKRVQLAGRRKTVYQAQEYSPADEHRKFPRQKIGGMVAHISDGVNCCQASVCDISQRGICLACPKGRLNQDMDNLGVLLTGAGKSYQMKVKPQWHKPNGSEQSIGAAIIETLGGWEDFAQNLDNIRYSQATT